MAKTELQRLIGEKWFLTVERLAKEMGLSAYTLHKVLQGGRLSQENEERLRRFLKSL